MESNGQKSCRICDGLLGEEEHLREVMFGTGERFSYATCGDCDTLQIITIPTDMSQYYPDEYYSFGAAEKVDTLRRFVRKNRLLIATMFPRSASSKKTRASLPQWLFKIPHLNSRTSFLDVGCGEGALLQQLAGWGFTNLHGVDPFVDASVKDRAVTIHKAKLADLTGSYDVVMMHHSIEHVENPRKQIINALRLLKPDGRLIIRIPIKGGYLWDHYGTDWAQIDPPRHFYLFTQQGFTTLAQSERCAVEAIYYDAHSFSFWGSELVKRGLTLQDKASISAYEMSIYESRVVELNASNQSDQACFIFTHS